MDPITIFLKDTLNFNDLFLCIADPLSETLDPVTAGKVIRLKQELLKPAGGIPSEIASCGSERVGESLSTLGYEEVRSILIKAAEAVASQNK